MSKEVLENPIKVIVMLKLEDGRVIDAEELTDEQRRSFIEF